MFSNLLRQQARLALSTRLAVPLRQPYQKSVLALSTQKSHILSQRTFSISRSLFEEAPVAPVTQSPEVDATSPSQTANTGVAGGAGVQGQRTIFIGNLPFSVEEDEVRGLFEAYGPIESIKLMADADGHQRGFGFVQFQSPETVAAILESDAEEPFVLLNRNLRVSAAEDSPPRNRKYPKEKTLGEPTSTIHIANYPTPGDEGPIRQMLGEYEPKITRVSFMKDSEGRDTQKAFVQFKNAKVAATVLELFQEKPLEGTNLKLYYAKEQSKGTRSRSTERSRARSFDA